MNVAVGRHQYVRRLEREPLAPPDPHRCEIDGIAEDGADEVDLAGCERPFSAYRANLTRQCVAPWSVSAIPGARTWAEAETRRPSSNFRVI